MRWPSVGRVVKTGDKHAICQAALTDHLKFVFAPIPGLFPASRHRQSSHPVEHDLSPVRRRDSGFRQRERKQDPGPLRTCLAQCPPTSIFLQLQLSFKPSPQAPFHAHTPFVSVNEEGKSGLSTDLMAFRPSEVHSRRAMSCPKKPNYFALTCHKCTHPHLQMYFLIGISTILLSLALSSREYPGSLDRSIRHGK